MTEIIYSKFSNERDRRFAVRTDILDENGRRFVKKSALYPEGKQHETNMLRWYEELSNLYEKAPFTCNFCEKGEDGVFFEYIDGKTMEEALDELLAADRVQEAQEHLMKYASIVQELHSQDAFEMTEEFRKVFGDIQEEIQGNLWKCAKITNIDLVCGNLILAEKPVAVDYEWTFDFPIPALFLVYRIIFYYGKTHVHRECVDVDAIFEKFGITEKDKMIFAEMEKNFQSYICGTHIPIREMYEDMTPGLSEICQQEEGSLQIYFSFGQGFSEENSMRIRMNGQRVERLVPIPESCTEIRLDPGDFACAMRIEALSFENTDVNLAHCVIPEGAVYGNWVYIAKEDPNICGIAVPEGAKILKVVMQVFPENEDVLKNTVAQLEQMQNKIDALEKWKQTFGGKVIRKASELIKGK